MSPTRGAAIRNGASFNILVLLVFCASLASCGGGGGDAGGGNNNSSSSPSPPQATVTFLHEFRIDLGDAGHPDAPLFLASDGNFYGTTLSGARQCELAPAQHYPCGAIYKMRPDGTESVFHDFGPNLEDGVTPSGPLMQGQDGALYGLTFNGGDYGGGGTAYKITLDGTYTVLHSFGGTPDDGRVPVGGLIQATDGNFYGVTQSGGANRCFQIPQDDGNCGTVFKMTPSGETTILYSFGSSVTDGVAPNASLVQASDGNLYGTTSSGGAYACTTVNVTNSCGTLFRTAPSGETTILYHFGSSAYDAMIPLGALIQGTDGALYGTTANGGHSTFCILGCGTVFKITLAGALSIMHEFSVTSKADGDGPTQYLLQASDGNFYGTTVVGGSYLDSGGTAFKLTPAGVLTTLYSFGPNTLPTQPWGGLIQGNDGALYGVTHNSGTLTNGAGNVFKLVP